MAHLDKSPQLIKAKNIIAAIPCLNEEKFIGDIVVRAKKYVNDVIVIDDGSTDNTSETARAAGAEVIRHEIKRGPGAATRTGFEAAKDRNADVLVTLDGDAQHNPDEIPRVLVPISDDYADLAIGSRFLRPESNKFQIGITNARQMPKYRKFGIDIVTHLYNCGSKTKVSDSLSCFRAYSRRLLDALDISDNGFGFSVEVLVQARKKGFIFAEVPISCAYHSQGSTIDPLTLGIRLALGVVKHRIKWYS